jgi:DNA-directed RNA polymerase
MQREIFPTYLFDNLALIRSSEYQPAFSHSYEYVRGNKLGVIKLNPEVASRMAKDSIAVVVHPKHMPMLIPPRPWKAHDDGAYLFHKGKRPYPRAEL